MEKWKCPVRPPLDPINRLEVIIYISLGIYSLCITFKNVYFIINSNIQVLNMVLQHRLP